MKYQYRKEIAPEKDVPEHDESKSTSQIEENNARPPIGSFRGFWHASER
jgi:hypothetical protein